MPVIRYVPQDPTDLVLQGEQMRAVAMGMPFHAAPAPPYLSAVMEGGVERIALNNPNLVEGEQRYDPMVGGYPVPPLEVLRDPFAGTMLAANACVSTPCGALYPHGIGLRMFDAIFFESTVRFALTGITKDSAGAPLANCRVVIFDVGQLAVGAPAIVAEGYSDGSGNYSIAVPQNTALEAIAYKPGSPDVAGITLNTIAPTAVG